MTKHDNYDFSFSGLKTALLRLAESGKIGTKGDENERKVILRIGFFAEVFHIKKIPWDKEV
jgi:tRNA A37 threonylcarbamoyltransferase TsaD